MKNKKEQILGIMIFIGLVSHYFFGYFLWDIIGSEKVYSITAYFCMDVWGLVVVILSKTRVLKGVGYLGMVLGTYYFYMEFNDPYNWHVEDYKGLATLAVSFINLLFLWHYTDLFKNLKR